MGTSSTASAALVTPLNKGLGSFEGSLSPVDLARRNWNLLREDLSLPTVALSQDRLLHNRDWMRTFISEYGLKLAPHGKTTMAPQLFQMQLEGGAWGITLATAHQTFVAHEHGVRRVLMANQLVGRQNMEMVSTLLRDPGFTYYCLVDSPALVHQLNAFFAPRGQQLNVLLELGVEGGRTGVRNETQADDVLAVIKQHKSVIRLCGVELYEGVLDDEGDIRAFLQRACALTGRLLAEGTFAGRPILTGAGSAWFDVVAEEFASAGFGEGVELVLRPGCYLTHDVGSYRRAQERMLRTNPVAHRMHTSLQPALHLWACVQSIPEPARAIMGFGKRDAAFDSGFPVAALHHRPGSVGPNTPPPHWEITKMMDQHAYLRIQPGDDLRVGDMVAFDICHPCLTFDKWRAIPVVNTKYDVIDVVQTFF
ncbi:amino acid deaminase [Acidobacteria bacterium AB60]|nr:amino acid deaminase [Acidobacteria bacterium AB60]